MRHGADVQGMRPDLASRNEPDPTVLVSPYARAKVAREITAPLAVNGAGRVETYKAEKQSREE